MSQKNKNIIIFYLIIKKSSRDGEVEATTNHWPVATTNLINAPMSYLWLTCPKGLEYSLEQECIEKFGVDSKHVSHELFGKVIVRPFPPKLRSNPELLWGLRGADYVLCGIVRETSDDFVHTSETVALDSIRDTMSKVPAELWRQAYNVWQKVPSSGFYLDESNRKLLEQDLNCKRQISEPTYYVTKKRGGVHSFSSSLLGRTVWEGMNSSFATNNFKWTGELGSTANLEVYCHLHEKTLYVGMRLHEESLWKKSSVLANNRVWVSTPLRPHICYGLLSDTRLSCGDILCDPMVGCGTVAEVAAETNVSRIFCIVGDIEKGKRGESAPKPIFESLFNCHDRYCAVGCK